MSCPAFHRTAAGQSARSCCRVFSVEPMKKRHVSNTWRRDASDFRSGFCLDPAWSSTNSERSVRPSWWEPSDDGPGDNGSGRARNHSDSCAFDTTADSSRNDHVTVPDTSCSQSPDTCCIPARRRSTFRDRSTGCNRYCRQSRNCTQLLPHNLHSRIALQLLCCLRQNLRLPGQHMLPREPSSYSFPSPGFGPGNPKN